MEVCLRLYRTHVNDQKYQLSIFRLWLLYAVRSCIYDQLVLHLRTHRAVVTDQAEVANLLADYFTSVASNIRGDHVNSLKENIHQEDASIKAIRETKLGSKFDFKLVDEVQVAKALDKLQPRKACGWNPSATPSLLKMAANGVAPSLTHLYNDCIITKEWPRQWKMGKWTPAFKKGGVQEKSNYRPITSLIGVDKVFEQLLGEQVTEHFNPILYSQSTVYRKKHSCETTLLSMLEVWKLAIDRRVGAHSLSGYEQGF